QSGDQNQKNQEGNNGPKTESGCARDFVKGANNFLLAKAMEGRIRKRAPAMPRQFHGCMRIQTAGFGQKVEPVPDLAIPLAVPFGALRLWYQQAGGAQQQLTLPYQRPNLRMSLHN